VPEYVTPGVYVEEVRARATTIEPAATSVTAFIGRTRRGPADSPRLVASFAEFERTFGALSPLCPMPYAVQQFFANGGTRAVIVRIRNGARAIGDRHISAPDLQGAQRGLWALEKIEAFNLLCIPPLGFGRDVGKQTWDAAATFCAQRGALLLIDAPGAWGSAAAALATEAVERITARSQDAALYFPRILANDPLSGATRAFAPCGAVAGVIARTDAARGVWKAPAGTDATLFGASALSVALSDRDGHELNAIGVNTLRQLPGGRLVVFGARMLAARERQAYQYVSLRRLHLHIERSLMQGLAWAAFERSDEALWVRVRSEAANFLMTLWRAGAFMGTTAEEGFFARCDRTTMTQDDVDQGRINIVVGFAPLKPAEFVVISLRLLAMGGSA
jgi:hypothetical protein